MKKTALFAAIIAAALQVWGQISNSLSETDKIYELSTVWSEVKRNFVYYDRLKFDWDSLYKENLENLKTCQNDYEFYKLLQHMVASLQDGHTGFYPPMSYWQNHGRPPIRTKLLEGIVVITNVYNKNLLSKGLTEGLEIIEIDGLPCKEYATEKVTPYVFASTPQGADVASYHFYLLLGPKQDAVTIKTKDKNGETQVFELDRNLEHDLPSKIETFNFSLRKDRVGVLEINNFMDEQFKEKFDSIYPRLLKSEALVIDIRNNGGGNNDNAFYVLKHFSQKPFKESAWRTRKYMPAFISWGKPEEWYNEEAPEIQQADGDIYTKPTAVLTSAVTFSSAEDFCVAFKQMNRGKIIGQPTGGSTGNPIFFNLPDGSSLRICAKEDTFANGDKFVGIGIIPDIRIDETLAGFRSGTDTVLDTAIKMIYK